MVHVWRHKYGSLSVSIDLDPNLIPIGSGTPNVNIAFVRAIKYALELNCRLRLSPAIAAENRDEQPQKTTPIKIQSLRFKLEPLQLNCPYP